MMQPEPLMRSGSRFAFTLARRSAVRHTTSVGEGCNFRFNRITGPCFGYRSSNLARAGEENWELCQYPDRAWVPTLEVSRRDRQCGNGTAANVRRVLPARRVRAIRVKA